jgi:hypothetical protein
MREMRGIGGFRGLDKILGWVGIMPIRAGSFAALRLAQDDVKDEKTHPSAKNAERVGHRQSCTHLLADYEEMAVVLAVDFTVLAYGERGIGCA